MDDLSLSERKGARSVLMCFLLTSTMLTSASAATAAAGPSNTGLELVIVTAEKQSQDLQKVPLSIIALGTEKLEQLNVASFNDYAKFLPSVSYQSTGPGLASVYVRGVASGENSNHSGPLPSVGMYLDEQPITTIGGALDIHVYDIARVEALAGPQGTLYGASSQSGTIRILTNKPDHSGFSASYDAEINSVAHGGIGYTGQGYVNIPLSDQAAIRLVGWEEADAGYIDNVAGTNAAGGIFGGVRTYPTASLKNFPGPPITHSNAGLVKNDYNNVQTFGGRAALEIDLDENWIITPTLMAQSSQSRGNFAFDPAVGDLKVVHFTPEKGRDTWYQAALSIQGKISNLDVTYAGSYLDRRLRTQSDYSDYSFFYDSLFGSYVYNDALSVIDPTQYILGKDNFTKFSHELRLSSPQSDRLRFIAGLFTQRQTHFIEQRYVIDDLASAISITGWPDTIWLTEQLRTDRDYAAFSEVSYDVTPQLTLTGGVRGYIADNSLVGFFGLHSYESLIPTKPSHPPCLPGVLVGSGPCTNLNKHVYEVGYTHKLNATYQINDDDMVYATWSTGFRPGGVNRNGSLPPYNSDTLTNYEIGWKTSWDNQSIRFNGALFWENWDGIQFSTIPPLSGGLTQIFNAGQARILGVESNVDWRATENLTLSAAATYIDAILTQDYCQDSLPCMPASTIDAAKGTALPVTPKFKANAVARYEWSWDDVASHIQGALVYQSSVWPALIASDRAVLGKLPAYTTVDLTAGGVWNNWSFELSIANVFDERGENTRFTGCATAVCSAQVYTVPIRPRLIGLRIGQRF